MRAPLSPALIVSPIGATIRPRELGPWRERPRCGAARVDARELSSAPAPVAGPVRRAGRRETGYPRPRGAPLQRARRAPRGIIGETSAPAPLELDRGRAPRAPRADRPDTAQPHSQQPRLQAYRSPMEEHRSPVRSEHDAPGRARRSP